MYTYKYINIINIIYILYMTALLLTFAVRRLFGRFFFAFVFFSLQDTRFPCFHYLLPRVTSCLLRTVGPKKLFFTFHIFSCCEIEWCVEGGRTDAEL